VWGATILMPTATLAGLMPNADAALVVLCATLFLLAFASGASVSAVAEATPAHLRGQLTALYYLAMSLVGLSIGPLSVALLTDYVFRDPLAIGRAMAISTAILGAMSLALLWWAWPAFRQAIRANQAAS
jgi:MFS family permease